MLSLLGILVLEVDMYSTVSANTKKIQLSQVLSIC